MDSVLPWAASMTSTLPAGAPGETYRLWAGPLGPDQLTVASFKGREGVSRLYQFDVLVTSELLDDTIERTALGHRAMFSLELGPARRTFHGIIAAIEAQGMRGTGGHRVAQHRLRLVPRLWMLRNRKRSRIFQDMRVDAVISAVLRDARIACRFRLQRQPPVRSYVTQYAESDLEFVMRLAAEGGMFFYFEQPSQFLGPVADIAGAAASALGDVAGDVANAALSEAVVFCDNAHAYPALDDDFIDPTAVVDALTTGAIGRTLPLPHGPTPALHVREATSLLPESHESIAELTARRALRATTATYRDYDPDRPQAIFSAHGRVREGVIDVSTSAASVLQSAVDLAVGAASDALERAGIELPEFEPPGEMEVYEHGARDLFPDAAYGAEEPRRILEQNRRRSDLARGHSFCARLHAGRRFALHEHPLDHMNQEYAVVSVEHHGLSRSLAPAESRTPVYRNSFRCVPARVPYLPPRPSQRVIQSCVTATVVGPEDDDIHVNAKGEIRVRFHWDREGAGANSSCWIRTMQVWGGAGWGTQFIPRVGMEVVVGFDGGDPDRPLVLGCLYNATHPASFALPADKTRSGIRTKSSPSGAGHNELSFEDASDSEQIYVHAQRDMNIVVKHDRTAIIERDDETRVTRDQSLRVEGAQRTQVVGDRHAELAADDNLRVEGARRITVRGDAQDRFEGDRSTRVEGRARTEIAGPSESVIHGDVASDVRGTASVLVGRSDAKRSCTVLVEGVLQATGSEVVDIASDAEILFRCGNSSIRITTDEIEIASSKVTVRGEDARLLLADGEARVKVDKRFQVVADETIALKAQQASVGLGTEAKIDGTRVLLNSPEQASDTIEVHEPVLTRIELVDQDGEPIPYRRYRVQLEDGTAFSGFLDAQGRAEVDLPEGGEIVFSDIAQIEPA